MRVLHCAGGEVVLPDPSLVLVDRAAGGHLIVNPPRSVWERSELSPQELTNWSFLIAATGRAMIDVLRQLDGGCINYWEAGNWSLHDDAAPRGPKTAPQFRQVHMHLLGRSRSAERPWKWGEAPEFPPFHARHSWAAGHQQLTEAEWRSVTIRAGELLRERYGMT